NHNKQERSYPGAELKSRAQCIDDVLLGFPLDDGKREVKSAHLTFDIVGHRIHGEPLSVRLAVERQRLKRFSANHSSPCKGEVDGEAIGRGSSIPFSNWRFRIAAWISTQTPSTFSVTSEFQKRSTWMPCASRNAVRCASCSTRSAC